MNEELEGTTTETAPQEDGGEIETAVDTLQNGVDQESVDEASPEVSNEALPEVDDPGVVDEAEAAVEAEEALVPEESGEHKVATGFEIDTDALTNEERALQAKAMAAFGLGKAETTEEEEDLQEVEEEEEPEEEIEELFIPDDGRAWYVVHCYSGYENKVRHSIEQRIETMDMQDKIFDVVVPTEEEIEIKDGKRRTVERRVFPGYILVQMLMSEDSWYVVRNTPGVTGFVGMGNEPTPLRPDEVAKIMNRMEAEAPKVKFDFQIGEKVRIGTGPFADFIGTVAEIDADHAKVRVMVSFFGRETPVELDFLHVEKV
jgi:transcriptional antiterminator NusG